MLRKGAVLAVLVLLVPCVPAFAAATIVIVNNDAAGVGFNDPTAVAPVGGNPGTTLGQQRLNAFQAAANVWGATLTSVVTIRIRAQWAALTCTATSAVLGSAGPLEIIRDFTGAPLPGHWYHKALTNKILGSDADPATPDINATFNVNLGQPGCLTGIFFYLGLDNNHGANVDLVTVLLHELAHGLGFSTFTNGSTGAQLGGFPSVWDDFLFDDFTVKTWTQMTAGERAASAIRTRRLSWNGANVTSVLPSILQAGTPFLTLSSPASVAGTYSVGTAAFGPPLASKGVTGEVMPVVDTAPSTGLACTPLSKLNLAAVAGRIALVDRGTCAFTAKVAAVQDAGAIGAIVVNDVAGSPPPGMGGTEPKISIPSVQVTLADGTAFKAALRTRSRLHGGMSGDLALDLSVRLGADPAGRALMYTPNPFQGGSSVSHWDTLMFPNQLMEPAINGDLTHSVQPPQDLTLPLLRDIGW